MRVLIVADTHGRLAAAIARLAGEVDLVVHGGDVGAAAVLAALAAGGARVVAVRGNNDTPAQWPPGEAALPATLPVQLECPLPGGVLAVCHGDAAAAPGRHAWLRRRFPEARAIVYGHSHRLLVDTAGTPWLLNPGAAGRARTYGGPSCLLLEARPDGWDVQAHRVSADAWAC
ncbi:hypothetical protein EV699_10836 [Plasticicumulans lactativorans]|uniref:Phosphoesterase n=1 Tax=Plasticicumulans lactativorans TaxID=1133106 RepID=A0A4R2LPG3_9GAMM|nr:metallophosphoesterase family protein [Plasticicumulans lactativorans]TCO81405.1 hypothetical protein EV699_10836 [Plasticicumulans lactativorans]